MKDLKIVTDSGADLSQELITKYNIDVIPIPVQIEEKSYKDRKNLSPDAFYEKLDGLTELPTTSQIPPYVFQKRFSRLLEEYERIFYINFSSQLSGIYNSALTTTNSLNDKDRITIFDSKAASMGQGLLVVRAARLARAGNEIPEIYSALEEMRTNYKQIFRVGSLEMLKKGGRISSAKAFVGAVLNINPILEVNQAGEIVPRDKVRGEEKMLNYFITALQKLGTDLAQQTIGISHGNAPKLTDELVTRINNQLEVKEIIVTKMGAAIGSHAGPGTIALFFN